MTTADLTKLGYTVVNGHAVKIADAPKQQPTAARERKAFKRFVAAQVVSEANRREWKGKNKRKKDQQLEVARAFGFELTGRGQPRRVKLVLLSEKRLDSDNLRSATKGHRDQIAKLCGFDDAADIWQYDQRPPFKYETRGVWILVEF